MHESSYDTKTDHGAPKKQCVGILSHLSKQNELPQQEILLLASCSKHCHHFSFFFFWGSGRGTVCVAHYRNSCISLCKVRSRTCSHGWLGTDRLSNMQLTSCVEKHIMQGWKGKKRHSWSRWLSRKFQCNVEVCGIWAAAARRELWGANAPGLYRILFTNLTPDPPPPNPTVQQTGEKRPLETLKKVRGDSWGALNG